MNALHVLLVTGRPAIHTFFTSLRQHERSPLVISQCPLAITALDNCPAAAAAVAVVDVAPDPIAAIAVCQELRRRRPERPILGLLCCPHALTLWQLQALLVTGVGSLLDLHTPPEEVLHALQGVAQGQIVLRARLAGDWASWHASDRNDCPGGGASSIMHLLTQVSTQLLMLVAQGLSDGEIGQQLHLSPHTVKHLIERLRDDIGARNRIALAAWAGRQGFGHSTLVNQASAGRSAPDIQSLQ